MFQNNWYDEIVDDLIVLKLRGQFLLDGFIKLPLWFIHIPNISANAGKIAETDDISTVQYMNALREIFPR